jgi:hypothetical protein
MSCLPVSLMVGQNAVRAEALPSGLEQDEKD